MSRSRSTEQDRKHECPSYCHPCPFLRGAVMPMCMGTVTSYDELDMGQCTCRPADPVLTRLELGEFALRAMRMLRDRRRFRQVQRRRVKAIYQLANQLCSSFTPHVNPRDREIGERLADLSRGLLSELNSIEELASDTAVKAMHQQMASTFGLASKPS
jgi:hypothetical protein